MNETNYVQNLIMKVTAIIIYMIFIIIFIVLGVLMFIKDDKSTASIIWPIVVVGFISYALFKKIKSLVSIIKEIKEKKKFNVYVRNIGEVFMGLSIITFFLRPMAKLFEYNGHFIMIAIIGVIISIFILIIDWILEKTKTNNIIFEYDKSND